MEVKLTVEDAQGVMDTVRAPGRDYAEALAAAKEKIPAGFKAIVIRTYE